MAFIALLTSYISLVLVIIMFHFIGFLNMKNDLLKILLKVIIYALGLLAAFFGVTSLSSCSVNRSASHQGTGYFQYYDTIHVHGQSNIAYPIKSK